MDRLIVLTGLAVLLLGTACNRTPLGGHSHGGGDHAHGEEKAKSTQFTVWSERYEVFAEHALPIAGELVQFVTHVTDLTTLEPRREGPVKFILKAKDSPPLEHLQAGPDRAGIYLPRIVFPKAGDYELSLLIPTGGDNVTVSLPTVTVFASNEEVDAAELPEAPDGISFLKEQQWKILTRSEPARKQVVTEDIRLLGTVSPKPGSMGSVSPPVAGRLILPEGKLLPIPGQKVEMGETLILLEPSFSDQAIRLLEIEAEAVQRQAAFDQAKLNLQRVKALAKDNAKSPRELQEAEFAFKSSEAAYEASVALQSTYNKLSSPEGKNQDSHLDRRAIELRSPVSGQISHVDTGLGKRVTPDQVLFTVLNPDQVWIEARLPESRLATLQETPSAHLPEGRGESLRFAYLGMQIDPSTRTVPLVFEANNTNKWLRIGETVEVRVHSRVSKEGVAVPEASIVEEDGRPIAFIQLSGETFEKRDLVLGLRGGGLVQVLEGVSEGDRVVTKGAYAIRLASVSSVIPAHGHAH